MIKMEKCKNPLYEEEAQVSKIFSRLGPLSSLMRDAVQLKLEFEKFNKNQNIKIFNPSAIFHFKTIRILICDLSCSYLIIFVINNDFGLSGMCILQRHQESLRN